MNLESLFVISNIEGFFLSDFCISPQIVVAKWSNDIIESHSFTSFSNAQAVKRDLEHPTDLIINSISHEGNLLRVNPVKSDPFSLFDDE